MHLRTELLRSKKHESEVSPPLGNVEQHLAHVRIGTIARRVLVELVHEHHHVIDAQRSLFKTLPQLRDHAREDQVLRVRLEIRDVNDVHRAITECAKRQVAHGAVVRHEAAAARGNVAEPIAHLADRCDMVRAP